MADKRGCIVSLSDREQLQILSNRMSPVKWNIKYLYYIS